MKRIKNDFQVSKKQHSFYDDAPEGYSCFSLYDSASFCWAEEVNKCSGESP
jgi:hypothetical protein